MRRQAWQLPIVNTTTSQTLTENVTCGWQNYSRRYLDHWDQLTVLNVLSRSARTFLQPPNIQLIRSMFSQSCSSGAPGYLRCHYGHANTSISLQTISYFRITFGWHAAPRSGKWLRCFTQTWVIIFFASSYRVGVVFCLLGWNGRNRQSHFRFSLSFRALEFPFGKSLDLAVNEKLAATFHPWYKYVIVGGFDFWVAAGVGFEVELVCGGWVDSGLLMC